MTAFVSGRQILDGVLTANGIWTLLEEEEEIEL